MIAFPAFWCLLFLGNPSNTEGGKQMALSNTFKVSLQANLCKGKDFPFSPFPPVPSNPAILQRGCRQVAHLLARLHWHISKTFWVFWGGCNATEIKNGIVQKLLPPLRPRVQPNSVWSVLAAFISTWTLLIPQRQDWSGAIFRSSVFTTTLWKLVCLWVVNLFSSYTILKRHIRV